MIPLLSEHPLLDWILKLLCRFHLITRIGRMSFHLTPPTATSITMHLRYPTFHQHMVQLRVPMMKLWPSQGRTSTVLTLTARTSMWDLVIQRMESTWKQTRLDPIQWNAKYPSTPNQMCCLLKWPSMVMITPMITRLMVSLTRISWMFNLDWLVPRVQLKSSFMVLGLLILLALI